MSSPKLPDVESERFRVPRSSGTTVLHAGPQVEPRSATYRLRRSGTAPKPRSGGAILSADATRAMLAAFNLVQADSARETADAIDEAVAAGRDPGPLAGVPIALK